VLRRDCSTLTGTLNVLAARGLISRRRKSTDQRSYPVRLAPKGVTTLERMRVHADRHDARLDAIVGQHTTLLLKLLRRIAIDVRQNQP
jgi:DNA-binding MarR family transcriptional regulator